jgi:hypothetical protein
MSVAIAFSIFLILFAKDSKYLQQSSYHNSPQGDKTIRIFENLINFLFLKTFSP